MDSGSRPVRNFLLRLIPLKSTYTRRGTSNPLPETICEESQTIVSITNTKSEYNIKYVYCFQQKYIFIIWQHINSHLCSHQVPVFVAVNLPVLLERAALGTCTHEVEVTLTGGEATAHGGSWLPATITALEENLICTHIVLGPQGTCQPHKMNDWS